ncbi:MAG TPA: hypothetical protein VM425_06090 [Myxococcota bacterium]|nr:hypothetical protein [Myxococcota bacterium]
MSNLKKIVLVALFLGIIYAVPVTQAILDLAAGDSPQVIELFREAPTEKHLRSFEADLEDYSFFEETVRPPFQLVRYFAMGDMGAKALAGRDNWYFFQTGVRYLTEPYFRDLPGVKIQASGTVVGSGDADTQKGGDPVEIIADFAGQMNERGIKLLIVIMPGKAGIYPDKLSRWVAPATPVYKNSIRFMDELRKKGVESLDIHTLLTAERKAADSRGEPLYMTTDTHVSGLGVRLVAAAIAARVKQEPWYQELEHRRRYVRNETIVSRPGDIPRMTRLPLQEFLFPAETTRCYQVSDSESGELYTDGDSPILMLGDSFSRVFQTDEPGAAGIIANLAYELQLPLSSIVNDGGASTLVRQQLARKTDLLAGKRLIIWEFVERDIRFGMRGWQIISFAAEAAETKTHGD